MNKKLVFCGIALVILCIGTYFWMHAGSAEKPVSVKQIAAVNNAVTTSAGQASNQIPVKSAPAPQPATAAQPATAQQPENKPDLLPPEELAKIRGQLKQSLENNFTKELSFPLDEAKMIAYAQASLKVTKTNNKWDVQIAGAENDQTAIEYNNQAVEEITNSMKNMQGLTLDQYNEMTKLTAKNKDFNNIYQVYKQLIDEGQIKTGSEPVSIVAPPSVPAVTAPQATAAKPVAAPVSRGTVPAPQGSPAPRYSQQPSR